MRYFCLLLCIVIFACSPSTESNEELIDLLIENGSIYDSSTDSFIKKNIGIKGEKIVSIQQDKNPKAHKTINAEGYFVAPGFIDMHTHALHDLSNPKKKENLNYLFQGVTTVMAGNDGGGPIHTDSTLLKWSQQGIGTNAGLFAGHRTIRRLVMGMDDRQPTKEELNNMKTLVERSMKAGAFGLSTGLYYAPNSYATTDEVITLAKIASSYGGIYDSHIRDESTYNIGLINAIKETVEIGKEGNLPVNISHIKALGVDVWGKSNEIISIIEEARSKGQKVTADQYPYVASSTGLASALVPRWVMADSDDYTKRFDDPKLRKRIVIEIKENLRKRGGANSILIVFCKDKSLERKYLEEIAKNWKVDPVEATIRILQETGGASIGSFNMNEEDLHNFMQQEWVMTCSDGSVGHPRKFGTYPQKIKEFVYDKKVIDMPTMIRQSSVLPSQVLQLEYRGDLKEGYYADLIIFKGDEVKPNATFEAPTELAVGMHYVIVNGTIAIEKGKFTGSLAGKPLRLGED